MTNMIISTSVAIILPVIVFSAAWVLSTRPSQTTREKTSPFECGFDPNHSARIPFSMRFFLLAIIFIVFDIEIVLLIPLPLIFMITNSSTLLLGSSMFLLILLIGLIHEWNQGSLNWSD
uniref:NADH dehydrogenase subunit 3 n=1 Tax=Enchytraeus irregularis TaxID=2867162 RepID=UPI0022FDADCC|nr:NADH dehydrogenase subunit 3 [Enchytraeus irregularis]WAS35301.1 NADH dehydrogenase subunit 3 [Enchytraeus irregularis]